MSDDMLKLAGKYDAKVEQVYPNREYFFQSRTGKMYSQSCNTESFMNLLISAGLHKKTEKIHVNMIFDILLPHIVYTNGYRMAKISMCVCRI
jgi:hypothetical protein